MGAAWSGAGGFIAGVHECSEPVAREGGSKTTRICRARGVRRQPRALGAADVDGECVARRVGRNRGSSYCVSLPANFCGDRSGGNRTATAGFLGPPCAWLYGGGLTAIWNFVWLGSGDGTTVAGISQRTNPAERHAWSLSSGIRRSTDRGFDHAVSRSGFVAADAMEDPGDTIGSGNTANRGGTYFIGGTSVSRRCPAIAVFK